MATDSRRIDGSTSERREQMISLVEELSDPNGRRRRAARLALVKMGSSAVPLLVDALKSRRRPLRWEAAKALGQIGDATTVDALLLSMLDEDPEIRWLAAEGLASIGPPAVVPLLRMLMAHANRTVLRMGAHFVLRKIASRDGDGALQPVLQALEGVEPSVEVPIAAEETLIALMQEPE